MHINRIKITQWLMMAALFFVAVQIQAQEVQDTVAVQEEERAVNEFSISAKLNTRGEFATAALMPMTTTTRRWHIF